MADTRTGKGKSAGPGTRAAAGVFLPLPAVLPRHGDPAAVRRKKWKVREPQAGGRNPETPQTDLSQRTMVVPLDGSDESFAVRVHEQLHAALSPVVPGGMDVFLLAAEDGRIESLATRKGLTRPAIYDPAEQPNGGLLAGLLAAGRTGDALLAGISLVGTPAEMAEIAGMVGHPDGPMIAGMMRWARDEYAADPSFASAERVAERLRDMFSGDGGGGSGKGGAEAGSGDGDGKGSGKAGDPGLSGEGTGKGTAKTPAKPGAKGAAAGAAAAQAGGTGFYAGPAAPLTVSAGPVPASPHMGGGTGGRGTMRRKDEPGLAEYKPRERAVPPATAEKRQDNGLPSAVLPVSVDSLRESVPVGRDAARTTPEQEARIHVAEKEYEKLREKYRDAEQAYRAVSRGDERHAELKRAYLEASQLLNDAAKDYRRRAGDGSRRGGWGVPSVQAPALPTVIRGAAAGRKRTRATDAGVVPTRMFRATVDGKVFAGRKHTRQGTVLVDVSGSMSLSAEQIRDMIMEAPAAVVATYCGGGGRGVIRIVAAGGRMASAYDLRPEWGGNEIDGPAVAWLARQRGPRIWVTDEGMCSQYGVTMGMTEQVYALCRQSRIRIVPGPEDVAQYLR